MNLDGETMETKKPVDDAAGAESSASQGNERAQTSSQQAEAARDAAPQDAAPKANGKSGAADSKVKPKAVATRMQAAVTSAEASGSRSRPGTAAQRLGNLIKSNASSTAAVGKATTAAKSSAAAGAIPKRPMGAAGAPSPIKNQTRMPGGKPVGQARTTSAAPFTVTNSTKPPWVNPAAKKRPGADGVAVRPKTTGTTNRPAAAVALKPGASTTVKASCAAASKTTRPTPGTLTSRTASASSRAPKAATKSSVSVAAKPAASKPATAPSTGWASTAQLPKTSAAKKAISQPASAPVTKPTTAATNQATRKLEPSKTTATVNFTSRLATTGKAADSMVSQPKTKPQKSLPAKKPVTAPQFSPHKPPLGQKSSASSSNKAGNCTPFPAKHENRPTQAVSPFDSTKGIAVRNSTTPGVEGQTTASAAVTAAAAADVASGGQLEPVSPSANAALSATEEVNPRITSSSNLNEDDDEEKDGSQQVSEMSGTTQPTEESRPGSGGPVGGSGWRAGGALLSELDSEDVSGSHQGASELSAPGVLEGTESMDDLGDGSLKGAMEMEGASSDIPVNDFEDEDDGDRVCDMDVCSEWADEPQRLRHDNDEEEDEDVEMASEGVTESGLESYGNADEDDFVEDERLDNLNRVARLPPPPLLPSVPAAQWDLLNPFTDPWAERHPEQFEQVSLAVQVEGAAAASPMKDPWQSDLESPALPEPWLERGPGLPAFANDEAPHQAAVAHELQNAEVKMYEVESDPVSLPTLTPAALSAPGMSLSSILNVGDSVAEDVGNGDQVIKFQSEAPALSSQPALDHQEVVTTQHLHADQVLGGHESDTDSKQSSSSSVTEDKASDTEEEAQLDDSLGGSLVLDRTLDCQPTSQRLSTVEELEAEAGEDTTPPSATSLASYGFDTMTTASNSNAHSTGESCIKSPGIFSLEELPEEHKEPCVIPQPHGQPCAAEQRDVDGKKPDEEPGGEETPAGEPELSTQQREENSDQPPPCYSAICEKTENSLAGFTALLHPQRRDHASYPRTYCDIIKPHSAAVAPPKLTCADLPPRPLGQQALSPQLRRLEQHQRQLRELQQRREQQNRPLEEAEQERKRREEEEQRRKKEEAEEEIKRNKEETQRKVEEEEERNQRKRLELQQQQEELIKWQPELQAVVSPSSGLCTIYEALENSDEEDVAAGGRGMRELRVNMSSKTLNCESVAHGVDKHQDLSPSPEVLPPVPDIPLTKNKPSQDRESPPPASPHPAPLDLDWGKKVDIVQHLINQTLLLNRDSCSSVLVLPGGAGGTLSPLESSLWPSLLPPLTPPSATVTSVSSFSPEATGSSPQGDWTVVELETHH